MTESKKPSGDCIKCPNCGELIPITETLHHQLTEKARDELRQELLQQQKALATKEKELQGRENDLGKAEKNLDHRVEQRLAKERAKLVNDALARARAEVSLDVKALQEEAAERDRKLQEAQDRELQLRKERRELDAAKRALELETARRIDAERQRIREETLKEASEQHHVKDAEKDHKLREALRANEELQRKLQQGSQQTQGEVLELELEEILTAHCPFDEILPVSKGTRGADVLQRVSTRSGVSCGSIIWEAKRTKNWSDGWISKLKDDQREAKADVAVLVTDTLPKDISGFGFRDGIWITTPRLILGLAVALRQALMQVAHARLAAAGKNEKIETVFNYLTGSEFRQRVEAIVRGFIAMKEDLEEEKRVSTKRWAKREKQLDLIIGNTSGMYGDLQGLIGTSMQPIPALEPAESEDAGAEEGANKIEAGPEEDIPF